MKKVLLALSGFLVFFQSFSQLSLSPNEVFAKCPNEFIGYTITNAANAVCTYEWTVTNGEILGGSQNGSTSTFTGGNQVQIKWLNTTSSGSIQVNATNCNPSSGNSSKTWTIPILSINGVSPSAVTGASTINVNVTSNQVYSIDQINYPNIGTGDVNPKQVDSYEWEIPSGWTVVSGGNTKSITVKPDNCSGGNIRVRGKNTTCINGPFFSNFSPVKTVTRTIPTPSAITGPTSVNCTDVTSKTYSVTNVTGATYTWSLPVNWQGSSTTNSITVTPTGTNAGTISVVASICGLQSQPSTLTIQLNQFDPSTPPQLTGVNLICSTGQFSISNQPPSTTITWSTSNSSALSINSSGLATRINNFNGNVNVIANISGSCGNLPPISKTVYIGSPLANNTTLIFPSGKRGINPVTLCAGCTYTFGVDFVPGASSYTWVLPSGFSFVSNSSTSTPGIKTSLTNGTYTLYCSPFNTCGSTWTKSLTIIIGSGGGGQQQQFAVFPNPASSSLIIEPTESNLTIVETEVTSGGSKSLSYFSAKLLDKTYTEVKNGESKGGRIVFDVQDLISDIYYLHITRGQEIIIRQILINK